MLGERYASATLVLPAFGFVATACGLGVVNVMVALLARAVAPETIGTLTGLTRCLFTLGYCTLPAPLVPLLQAGGLIAPCALVAALFVVTAALLQLAAHLPDAVAAGGTDGAAILPRSSAVEGVEGAEGAEGAGGAGGAGALS